jgi:hypothetical protein
MNPNVDFNNDFQVRPTNIAPTTNPTTYNNDYQVPPGYIADENGMIVPVKPALPLPTDSTSS